MTSKSEDKGFDEAIKSTTGPTPFMATLDLVAQLNSIKRHSTAR
jgi:hypothetical protein